MPKVSKTTIATAIGVAVGGVLYAKFLKTHVQTMLMKVA